MSSWSSGKPMSNSVMAMMGAALCSSCVLLILCAFCMVPVQICETHVETTAPALTTVPRKFSCTSFTVATATPCARARVRVSCKRVAAWQEHRTRQQQHSERQLDARGEDFSVEDLLQRHGERDDCKLGHLVEAAVRRSGCRRVV